MDGDSPNPIVHIPNSGDEDLGRGGGVDKGVGQQRADAKTELRAAREHWAITPEQRRRAVERIMESMEDTDDGRAVAALNRALAEYSKINLASENGGAVGDVTVRVVYDSPKPSQ